MRQMAGDQRGRESLRHLWFRSGSIDSSMGSRPDTWHPAEIQRGMGHRQGDQSPVRRAQTSRQGGRLIGRCFFGHEFGQFAAREQVEIVVYRGGMDPVDFSRRCLGHPVGNVKVHRVHFERAEPVDHRPAGPPARKPLGQCPIPSPVDRGDVDALGVFTGRVASADFLGGSLGSSFAGKGPRISGSPICQIRLHERCVPCRFLSRHLVALYQSDPKGLPFGLS